MRPSFAIVVPIIGLAGVVLLASVATQAAADVVVRATVLADPGGRVGWSHTRNLIALDRAGADGYMDVYTIRPDGTGLRCLTCAKPAVPQQHNGNPAWHPSGAFIVFQAQDPNLRGGPDRLAKQLASPGIGINNDIWIMDAGGNRYWQITHVPERGGVLHAHFSHDGTKLLWSEVVPGERGRVGRWAVKLAEFSAVDGQPRVGNIRTLRPGGLQLYETHAFSPDDRRILFAGIPVGGYYYDMDIYAYDLATGRLDRLNRNDEWDEHAQFTLDGTRIVWASSEGIPQRKGGQTPTELKLDYWIMGADGANPRRLTRFNDRSAPEYVPGGEIAADFEFGPGGLTIVSKFGAAGRGERSMLITFTGGIR